MTQNSISQLGIKEPDPVDWDNYNPGSTYKAPPPAKTIDGKPITYFGQAPKDFTFEATDDQLLQVVVDPIKIVKSTNGQDGYVIRFSRINARQFKGKDGKPINATSLGNYLRANGITAKPQRNVEYEAAIKQTAGRVFPMVLDWFGKDKVTGTVVRGYDNFPDDPERPGQKKAILKAGDKYRDQEGVEQVFTGEVLFANAVVRYFPDPNRK